MEGWVDLIDLIAPRLGVELATFRSRVRHPTTAPRRQKVTGYKLRWFTRTQTATHPGTNSAMHGQKLNLQTVDHKSDALTTTVPNYASDTSTHTHRQTRRQTSISCVLCWWLRLSEHLLMSVSSYARPTSMPVSKTLARFITKLITIQF